MTCCDQCFADENLATYVRSIGTRGKGPCDHCGAAHAYYVSEPDLRDSIVEIVDWLYCQVSELSQSKHIDPLDAGEPLAELLDEDFEVFSDDVADRSELLDAILSEWEPDDPDAGRYDAFELWARKADDWGHWSLADMWGELEADIQRFGHGLLVGDRYMGSLGNENLMDMFKVSITEAACNIDRGTVLYRARRAEPGKRMHLGPPPPEHARAGRGNLQGQPVLYLASDEATALHEVRPGVGDIVKVARFKLARGQTLADLTPRKYESPFGRSIEDARRGWRVQDLCRTLGERLARPVRREDEPRDYIVTQFMCGLAARAGFDGVRFPSAQRSGEPLAFNYLLFDTSAAKQIGRPVAIEVKSISYNFKRRRAQRPGLALP